MIALQPADRITPVVLRIPSGPTLRPSPAPCPPAALAPQVRLALPPTAAAAPSTLASVARLPLATAVRRKRALQALPRLQTPELEELEWSSDKPLASGGFALVL
jgi:hypothetical protein